MIPVVVGIIRRGDLFLVAERPVGKPYSGYWEFPGGKVEPGEDALTALKRELHEELGIDVTEASLWQEREHTYPDKTVFLSLWQVHHYHGEPQSLENQTLAFVTIEQMRALRLLEGNRHIMVALEQLA